MYYLKIYQHFLTSCSTTIIEEPEEPCSGSVSPPALEQLPNNLSHGNYNEFNYDDLSRMSVDQLQAIAKRQDIQIQQQNQFLNERKYGKPKHQQHQLLLNAYQRLSQIQNKVLNFRIY